LKSVREILFSDHVAQQPGKIISKFLAINTFCAHAVCHLLYCLDMTRFVNIAKAILDDGYL
jgi:hypothetical protein